MSTATKLIGCGERPDLPETELAGGSTPTGTGVTDGEAKEPAPVRALRPTEDPGRSPSQKLRRSEISSCQETAKFRY